MLILPVSATGRHEKTPAIGYAAFFISSGRLSISDDTFASSSATPFSSVTFIIWPFGNHGTDLKCRAVEPLRQSPYSFLKKASLRNRPGSKFTGGGSTALPAGYRR